jgi:deoxyhypusine synthase
VGQKEARAVRDKKAKEYLTYPEKAIEVTPKSVSELLDAMSQTGFQGKRLGEAARIWSEMVQQKGLTIFMGYAGSMSTTGQWKIVRWLIENRYIDVLVSTGANISEDIFEAMGHNY